MDEAADGYLPPGTIQQLLDAAGIPRVEEGVATDQDSLKSLAADIGFPLAMKVVGPIHKSDVGGVALGIDSPEDLISQYELMRRIDGATGVLLQPMLEGMELFAGAKYEPAFGHVVLCGIGGIYVEVMKDLASGLAPLSLSEAEQMIQSLKGYNMLGGIRGQDGINIQSYAEILVRLSTVLRYATEIAELDLNPIMGRGDRLAVVDARIRIDKSL
jgi:acetyltransferase